MRKLFKPLTAFAAVALFAGALLAPHAAEARIVCRAGWGWHGDRCVRVVGWNHGWHRGWHRNYHRVHYYEPRHYYHRPHVVYVR
ncbi:MAG TPA: hypothetical protein VHB73_03295 [Alphaproteobacteria bacterium]|nr:hypothetical protein [Alphaproteobacteria bacterium]